MAIVVISGPSGVGKNTIIEQVFKALPQLRFSSSLTTRQPRDNDVPGKYEYVDHAEFEARVKAGELLEWAEVHGNLYGTKKPKAGENVLLEIDVQGARQVKENLPEALLILVAPPGDTLADRVAVLRQRLVERQTDENESIEQRLQNAERELIDGQAQSDVVIVNVYLEDSVEQTVQAIKHHLGNG